MIKKIMPIALIIIGIVILLLPSITDEVIKRRTIKSIEKTRNLTSKELEENSKRGAEFDFGEVCDIEISSVLIAAEKFDQNHIIGEIIIPDINLNLPVMKGISETNLMEGAATMKDNQIMGKGNFALAGHCMKSKDVLFGGLMDIKDGSIIKLTDKNTVYEYVVSETLVLPDTSTDMIEDSKSVEREKPIITLMTCYFSSKTGKRFFAIGEFSREYPYNL